MDFLCMGSETGADAAGAFAPFEGDTFGGGSDMWGDLPPVAFEGEQADALGPGFDNVFYGQPAAEGAAVQQQQQPLPGDETQAPLSQQQQQQQQQVQLPPPPPSHAAAQQPLPLAVSLPPPPPLAVQDRSCDAPPAAAPAATSHASPAAAAAAVFLQTSQPAAPAAVAGAAAPGVPQAVLPAVQNSSPVDSSQQQRGAPAAAAVAGNGAAAAAAAALQAQEQEAALTIAACDELRQRLAEEHARCTEDALRCRAAQRGRFDLATRLLKPSFEQQVAAASVVRLLQRGDCPDAP